MSVTEEQVAWLRGWFPGFKGEFRGLQQVQVQIGYCETCRDTFRGVRGERLVDGEWREFVLSEVCPGWLSLPVPPPPADEYSRVPDSGNADDEWRDTHSAFSMPLEGRGTR